MSYAQGLLKRDLLKAESELQVLQEEADQIAKTQALLLETINLAKDCIDEASQARELLEEGVTAGLQYTFEKEFVFKILNVVSDEGEIKGNKLAILYNGVTIENIEEVLGTGVKRVTDFLLFMYCLIVQKTTRKLIVADELLGSLSDYVWDRFGVWVCTVCEAFDLQMVLTTHHQTTFGKVYKIHQEDGISNLELVCTE